MSLLDTAFALFVWLPFIAMVLVIVGSAKNYIDAYDRILEARSRLSASDGRSDGGGVVGATTAVAGPGALTSWKRGESARQLKVVGVPPWTPRRLAPVDDGGGVDAGFLTHRDGQSGHPHLRLPRPSSASTSAWKWIPAPVLVAVRDADAQLASGSQGAWLVPSNRWVQPFLCQRRCSNVPCVWVSTTSLERLIVPVCCGSDVW